MKIIHLISASAIIALLICFALCAGFFNNGDHYVRRSKSTTKFVFSQRAETKAVIATSGTGKKTRLYINQKKNDTDFDVLFIYTLVENSFRFQKGKAETAIAPGIYITETLLLLIKQFIL